MESDVYACFYKYASLLSVLKNKIPKYCKKQIKNVQWKENLMDTIEKIVPPLKMKSDIMFKAFFSRKENE